jgi:hypothetical protein
MLASWLMTLAAFTSALPLPFLPAFTTTALRSLLMATASWLMVLPDRMLPPGGVV